MIAPRFPAAMQHQLHGEPPSVLAGLPGFARDVAQRALLVPAFRALFAPFEANGTKHLAAIEGPLIFAANHASHLDAPAVLAALPDDRRRSLIVAAAEDYFYGSSVRRLLLASTLSAYPFRRAGDSWSSLRQTEELLAGGRSVLLFPEGTRSPDGEIGRFRRGVATIATRSDAPVIPTYVDGAAEAMPKGAARPRRHRIAVTFGAPLHLDQTSSWAAFADELRERVLELREARRRGG